MSSKWLVNSMTFDNLLIEIVFLKKLFNQWVVGRWVNGWVGNGTGFFLS